MAEPLDESVNPTQATSGPTRSVAWRLDPITMTLKSRRPTDGLPEKFPTELTPTSFHDPEPELLTVFQRSRLDKFIQAFLMEKPDQDCIFKEEFARTEGGQTTHYEVTAYLTRLPDGTPEIRGITRDITQGKLARMIREEAAATMVLAYKITGSAYWTWHADSRKTTWSDDLYAVLGIPKDLEGDPEKHFWEHLHPEDVPRMKRALQQALTPGVGVFEIQFRFFPPTGSRRFIHAIGEVTFTPEGRPLRLVGTCRDITAERLEQEASRDRKNRFQLLTESMKDVVWTLDAESLEYLYLSPSIKKLRGYDPDDVMAMPFTAALTPRAKREVSKTFKKRLASFRANKLSTSDFFTDELEVFHKHGNRIWTENVTHFVHVRATGRIEIHGVSRDITDRKRAELALRESEERYRLLVDQLHVGVVVQTPTAEIVMANQKVLELLGLTEQEICGRTSFDPAWDVIHEDGAPFPSHEHPVPMAIRTLREVHNVVMGVFRPSTSDRIWILASASPQFEEDGALKQVICTFQDITGPRQQQEALRMAEAQNRAILAAIPDLVFINDRDHRFTFVHTPDEEALYAPPHAILGNRPSEVLPGTVAASLEGAMTEVLSTRQARIVSYPLWVGGHETFWEARIAPYASDSTIALVRDITAQKRAEEGREEAQEKYRTLADGSFSGVIISEDGICIDQNARAEELFGYSLEEIVGMEVTRLALLEDASTITQSRLADNGQPIEVTARRKDGATFPALARGKSMHFKGRVVRVTAITDLTDIKRTESSLRQSEQRFANIAANLPGVIFQSCHHQDGTFHLTYISPKFSEIFGLDASPDTPSDEIIQWIHPEDRKDFLFSIQDAVDSKKDWNFDGRLVTPTGIKWFHGASKLTSSGKQSIYSGLLLDVTEQKEAEQTIRKVGLAVEQSPVAIVITDREGIIEYVNPEFTTMTGYAPGEALGRNPKFLKSGELPRSFYENLWQTITSGQVWEGDVVNHRKDGSTFWEHSKISPVRDHHGRISHFVAVKEDITERRINERELQTLTAQLHHLQKMESLGRLAGGVAHDINNVLGAVLGLASAHAEITTDPRVRTVMDTIAKACLHGREVTSGLLDFARKDQEAIEPFSLNRKVRELVSLLEATTLKKAEVIQDLQDPIPPVLGDPSAIGNAIINLCVNAVDAMPEGGTLTIRTRFENGWISVAVQDTGIGMTPEEVRRAVEPFYTTKPPGKGTGLGLSTAYGTMKAHDGSVDIQSTPGAGTTVTLSFPAKVSDTASQEQARIVPIQHTQSLSILLVDDDPLIRSTASELLTLMGHAVVDVGSGEEAIERFDRGEFPDLVILDMNMPKMNGIETMRRLTEREPNQVFLVASGYLPAPITEQRIQNPRVHLIGKPFTVAELRGKLTTITNTHADLIPRRPSRT